MTTLLTSKNGNIETTAIDHAVDQFEIPPIVNLAQDDLHSKFYKRKHVIKNIARIEFEVQANSEVQIAFIFGSICICLEIVTVGLNVCVQDGTEKANDATT